MHPVHSSQRRSRHRLGIAIAAVISALALAIGAAGPVGADAASPTVDGELTGGNGAIVVAGAGFDLATVGYEQAEYQISGTASRYVPVSLPADGKAVVTPADPMDYTTRVVVYRPTDPADFNGNVIVEWLNVSGGLDAGPDWTLTHTELVREGAVWVGVSAQKVGIDATKAADPVRYADLNLHSDNYSYDVFSQVGQAIRDHADTLLGGLAPQHVIAMGESQSAGRLVTYIDAVHPLVEVYDGFLVHSRGAGGAALAQAPFPAVSLPSPTIYRDDLAVPVLAFQAETDVVGGFAARQPDTDRFRLWEVAGTAHFDYYGIAIGPTDVGDGQGAVLNLEAMQHPTASPSPNFTCNLPINTGPMHWVMNAAVSWIQRWVADGTPPPSAPHLEIASTSPFAFSVDADGNVLGGVRTPYVDVPIATLGGTGNGGVGPIGQFCRLFGKTEPFAPETLASKYPNHGAYVSAFARATNDAQRAGFLLPPDAQELKDAAGASSIGK